MPLTEEQLHENLRRSFMILQAEQSKKAQAALKSAIHKIGRELSKVVYQKAVDKKKEKEIAAKQDQTKWIDGKKVKHDKNWNPTQYPRKNGNLKGRIVGSMAQADYEYLAERINGLGESLANLRDYLTEAGGGAGINIQFETFGIFGQVTQITNLLSGLFTKFEAGHRSHYKP